MINLILNHVKFLKHAFYLGCNFLAPQDRVVVFLLRSLGYRKLLLDLALNLSFELLLQFLHLALVHLHLVLIGSLLDVVLVNRRLNLIADLRILLHLRISDFLFLSQPVLDNRHPFLEASAELHSLLTLLIQHLLVLQIQVTVLLKQFLAHGLQRITFFYVLFNFVFYVVDLAQCQSRLHLSLRALFGMFATLLNLLHSLVNQLLQLLFGSALRNLVTEL